LAIVKKPCLTMNTTIFWWYSTSFVKITSPMQLLESHAQCVIVKSRVALPLILHLHVGNLIWFSKVFDQDWITFIAMGWNTHTSTL
jgi:hypothetical protein